MRVVKQRLHQAMFRERVIQAYGRKCALTGLPEVKLVDEAHIMPDGEAALGQPDIRNGICMSEIHHAAYDADLIGVDPDFRIHVSEQLLTQHDGPMLEEGLKALAGREIRRPDNPALWPDRDRLEVRFALFRAPHRRPPAMDPVLWYDHNDASVGNV
jgi:putative restriction endonuclease